MTNSVIQVTADNDSEYPIVLTYDDQGIMSHHSAYQAMIERLRLIYGDPDASTYNTVEDIYSAKFGFSKYVITFAIIDNA